MTLSERERFALRLARAMALLPLPRPRFRILDEISTARLVQERRCSFVRFGDGEIDLMTGQSVYFQEFTPTLGRRLREVLHARRDDLLKGLPHWGAMIVSAERVRRRWRRYGRILGWVTAQRNGFGSAFVSRPAVISGLDIGALYSTVCEWWQGRDVVIVHHTEAVMASPLLANARSIRWVSCPPENAFSQSAAIVEACAQSAAAGALVVLCAGPLAKIAAHDLTVEHRIQSVDLGSFFHHYTEWVAGRALKENASEVV